MIEIKIFNTYSRELESFVPIERPTRPNLVTFYQCGPTVYWTQHLGNLRAMTCADLIRRSLVYAGYNVKFVRNYTDVGHLTGDNEGDADSGEDKMTKGARREGLTPDQIADKYIDIFEQDCKALGLWEPDKKTRATDYIKEMQKMVKDLLDKGFAYSTPRAVYFDISKFADYTKLNRQKLELNKKGAGKGDIEDSQKRNPEDFALWFFRTGVHAKALQFWPSDFQSSEVENGEGFPGWHIECSAMAKAELGETIDIHMGGIEHIAVHHTNEIAQSEAANGRKFVNYWLHNEWLMINGGKISKSDGTSIVLSDITAKGYDPLVLRYFFLNSHYRSQQNFTYEGLDASVSALKNLKRQVSGFMPTEDQQGHIIEIYRMRFIEALGEDFNVPKALSILWDVLKSDADPADKVTTVMEFDKVLGLGLSDLKIGSSAEDNKEMFSDNDLEIIKSKIDERNKAKQEKQWAEADAIRDELLRKYGVVLMDAPGGTTWTVT